MRYLVTGGAGFIGSHIVHELVRRGHGVVVLDDLSSGKEKNLKEVRNQIELRMGSITDPETVQKAIIGVDFVIHLAARTSVPRSVKDPIESNRINIDGTLIVLVASKDAKVRRIVYAASSSAYGETPILPKVQTMPANPISPYGVTKYVGELYSQVFGKVYGLENVCVRYFNVFGPRQDRTSQYSGVLSRFMLALLEGRQPVVYGDGEQTRDFTFVENVVDATLRACEAQDASGRVYNAGTGARISINEVLRLLEEISGVPVLPKYDPPRNGDIRDSKADIQLARSVLGYEPKVSFADGLRRTWEWYKHEYETRRQQEVLSLPS